MTKALSKNLSGLLASLERTREFVEHAVDSVDTFVKMGKDGQWTYGTDEMEVYEESEWAVNPFSFSTGYSAFDADGNRVGEEMRSMQEPPITRAELPTVNGQWSEQIGFGVKCLNTEDMGLEGVVNQRSRGGLESAKKVLGAVLNRVSEGHEDCVAVISLRNESYKHAKYGKIYKPVLNILRWTTMEDDEVPAEQEKLEPPVKKRKTRAAEPEPEPEFEEVDEPVASPRRRRQRQTA